MIVSAPALYPVVDAQAAIRPSGTNSATAQVPPALPVATNSNDHASYSSSTGSSIPPVILLLQQLLLLVTFRLTALTACSCRCCRTSQCPASSAAQSSTLMPAWITTQRFGSAQSATRVATSRHTTRASASRTCLQSCSRSTPLWNTRSTAQCRRTHPRTCLWWTQQ